MPELPEVETLAVDLDAQLRGKVISRLELIGKHSIVKNHWPSFKKSLEGKKIIRIFRRAKMVVIDLGDQVLLIHLKMTGQLIYVLKKNIIVGGHPIVSTGINVPNAFTRFVLYFKDGAVLYFNDIRKFGWIKLLTRDEFEVLDQSTGVEPLGRQFTYLFFSRMLERRKNTTIKAALLDQKQLVGLGNIYVDEVLFRSGVRPTRRVATLGESERKKLFQAIPYILKKSISKRGTTFRTFLDSKGERGNFMSFLKVYGRNGKQCPQCGAEIQKTRVAGRGSHWCKNCQK